MYVDSFCRTEKHMPYNNKTFDLNFFLKDFTLGNPLSVVNQIYRHQIALMLNRDLEIRFTVLGAPWPELLNNSLIRNLYFQHKKLQKKRAAGAVLPNYRLFRKMLKLNK